MFTTQKLALAPAVGDRDEIVQGAGRQHQQRLQLAILCRRSSLDQRLHVEVQNVKSHTYCQKYLGLQISSYPLLTDPGMDKVPAASVR
jgi:hypothetical protein